MGNKARESEEGITATYCGQEWEKQEDGTWVQTDSDNEDDLFWSVPDIPDDKIND